MESPKGSIALLDPVHLRALTPVKDLPRWPEDSAEFRGFVRDIAEHGIQQPLLVTNKNFVVDGETRRLAARHLNMSEVPCIVIPDGEVHGSMVRGIVQRRNLTKGQRAFLVAPFLAQAFNESLRREHSGKKLNPYDSIVRVPSAAERAEEMGFSHDLLNQAHRLHVIFLKKPALGEFWRPRILDMDDPVGLGAALAGIEGAKADQSGRIAGVLGSAFSSFLKCRDFWGRLSKQERAPYEAKWRETSADLPKDMRATIARALQEAA